MKKLRKIIIPLIIAPMLVFTNACSEVEESPIGISDVTERIDIVLEGNDTEFIYEQSLESESDQDLIEYNFYGIPSNQIDFKVNLDAGRTLVFTVINQTVDNPWAVETSYSLFPSSEIEDKQFFVNAALETGGEVPAFLSDHGEEFPSGTYVNVFQVVEYDPIDQEILCRVIDFPLKSTSGDQEIVTINGTFRGAVNFLN